MRHGALCVSASEHQIESHSNSQPETNDPQMAMDICLQMSFKFQNFTWFLAARPIVYEQHISSMILSW